MLVLLEGTRGVPEGIQVPARLTTCAEVWPLRQAIEREITRHRDNVVLQAKDCIQVSEPVLGWWAQLDAELRQNGRCLVLQDLRPELRAALESLGGIVLQTHEVPQATTNGGFAKSELPGQRSPLPAHQEPAAPLGTATILPLKY